MEVVVAEFGDGGEVVAEGVFGVAESPAGGVVDEEVVAGDVEDFGEAVQARQKREQAEGFAAMPDMGWRMKRAWRADAKAWAERERVLQQHWAEIGGPVLAGVDDDIAGIEQHVDELRGDVARRDGWLAEHPEAARRLDRIDRELETLRTVEGLDHHVARAMEHGLDRGIEPPGHGIELGW